MLLLGRLFGYHIDMPLVPMLHEAAHILQVDFPCGGLRPVLGGKNTGQMGGDVLTEDGRDKQAESPRIVGKVVVCEPFGMVGVAAHLLNSHLVGNADAQPFTKKVHLREQVAEGLLGGAHTLVARQHQRLVQLFISQRCIHTAGHRLVYSFE